MPAWYRLGLPYVIQVAGPLSPIIQLQLRLGIVLPGDCGRHPARTWTKIPGEYPVSWLCLRPRLGSLIIIPLLSDLFLEDCCLQIRPQKIQRSPELPSH